MEWKGCLIFCCLYLLSLFKNEGFFIKAIFFLSYLHSVRIEIEKGESIMGENGGERKVIYVTMFNLFGYIMGEMEKKWGEKAEKLLKILSSPSFLHILRMSKMKGMGEKYFPPLSFYPPSFNIPKQEKLILVNFHFPPLYFSSRDPNKLLLKQYNSSFFN